MIACRPFQVVLVVGIQLVVGLVAFGRIAVGAEPSSNSLQEIGYVIAPQKGAEPQDSSPSLASAGCCDTCPGVECRPFTISGWLDGGLVGNTSSPASKFNGPYNAVDRSNEAMFNQGYLIAERGLPTDGSWGLGARLDLLYGEDFFLPQSAGFELHPNGSLHWNPQYYGLAIPQAYGQIGNDALSVKVGHFYTPVGYEGVPAPTNFFYSKSYSYQFAGPFTHWGALGVTELGEGWQAQLGFVNGWNALDSTSDHLAELAGLKYTTCNWWTSFTIVTGDEFNNDAGLPGITPAEANRTRYSWIFDTQPSDRWEYVFNQWFGSQADGTADGGTAYWYGIDQYLYYRINNCWRSGVRFEWFRDEEGTRVGLNRPSNPNKPPFPGNFFSLTAGLNWTPCNNFVLRPEIRADWFDGDNALQRPYDDGAKNYQLMLAFDAIYQF